VCVTICVGTLGYSFSFINQTDQGDEDEGLKREGVKGERYKRERLERTFHCFNLNHRKCRFTVPSAVALLNYKGSGILWRIFSRTGIFAGFSLNTK
jgi:hypothetical protein